MTLLVIASVTTNHIDIDFASHVGFSGFMYLLYALMRNLSPFCIYAVSQVFHVKDVFDLKLTWSNKINEKVSNVIFRFSLHLCTLVSFAVLSLSEVKGHAKGHFSTDYFCYLLKARQSRIESVYNSLNA